MGLIKINIEMLNKIVLGKVTLQYFSSVLLFGPRLYSYEIERNKSIICSQCKVRFIFNLINKPLFYLSKKREKDLLFCMYKYNLKKYILPYRFYTNLSHFILTNFTNLYNWMYLQTNFSRVVLSCLQILKE